MNQNRSGIWAAAGAFFLWGILPVYWKHLSFLSSVSIVAQRTLWSFLVLLVVLLWKREGKNFAKLLRSPAIVCQLGLAGLLLASNWLIYIWSALNDRMIEGALGYYLNPFFNILFGFLWFGERHSKLQKYAIALAFIGAALQVPAAGRFPWIAFSLAITFSLYGVVKKRVKCNAFSGLAVETALLAPLACIWLIWSCPTPAAAFGKTWTEVLLVLGSGLATTVPLLFFGYAAKNIRLSTLGILQFIGPTIQFLLGWKLYGEPLNWGQGISFALIWFAIGLYAFDGRVQNQQRNIQESAAN